MKVTGQEHLLGDGTGKSDITSLLHYSMSLPVSTAVVGMPRAEMLEQNIEIARKFVALNQEEMEGLRKKLLPSRERLEKNLVGHSDGPTSHPHFFWA